MRWPVALAFSGERRKMILLCVLIRTKRYGGLGFGSFGWCWASFWAGVG
jgi:hypothetical protein